MDDSHTNGFDISEVDFMSFPSHQYGENFDNQYEEDEEDLKERGALSSIFHTAKTKLGSLIVSNDQSE